jgi:hypothetical protein
MGVQKRFALAWTARARKDLLDIGENNEAFSKLGEF